MTSGQGEVRFQFDEDVSARIIVGLRRRRPRIDIITAASAGLLGRPDPIVLAHAAAQNRILVSNDERTMPGHFYTFLASGGESPGLILARRALPIGGVVNDLLLIWEASGPDEWRNRIAYLPL